MCIQCKLQKVQGFLEKVTYVPSSTYLKKPPLGFFLNVFFLRALVYT